jgi:hypothetical protein
MQISEGSTGRFSVDSKCVNTCTNKHKQNSAFTFMKRNASDCIQCLIGKLAFCIVSVIRLHFTTSPLLNMKVFCSDV